MHFSSRLTRLKFLIWTHQAGTVDRASLVNQAHMNRPLGGHFCFVLVCLQTFTQPNRASALWFSQGNIISISFVQSSLLLLSPVHMITSTAIMLQLAFHGRHDKLEFGAQPSNISQPRPSLWIHLSVLRAEWLLQPFLHINTSAWGDRTSGTTLVHHLMKQ